MKRFDVRAYSISDFLEWSNRGQIELSPDYQRRSVWPEKAKSYLIDTIINGKPIPKIIITQRMAERRTLRIVVDGQQRLRAIYDFVSGNFRISRAHSKEFAGRTFEALPENIQTDFLQYEIGVDLLFETEYREILDIFARLNTYTVRLNSQELLNATYLGYFRQCAYELGYKYVTYFLDGGILSNAKVTRMAEAELSSDLLISLTDGVQTNKSIEIYYKKYEDDPGQLDKHAHEFDEIMSYVGSIYDPEDIKQTNWCRIHWFYSLFTSIAHGLYGLVGLEDVIRPTININTVGRLRVRLDEISAQYDYYTSNESNTGTPPNYADFIEKSRRGTTDTGARIGRASFICDELSVVSV